MSVTFNEVKSLGEVFLSYIREYENEWRLEEEIDTKEKADNYNSAMQRISKGINLSKDKFEIESRLQLVWHAERQANALEEIAVCLNKLLDIAGRRL